MPVIISPTGVQAVHPDGEVAVARAAAARGHRDGAVARSPASRSRRSSRPTRRRSSRCTGWAPATTCCARMERARRAGAVGLIATLDWSFSHGRDWGSPSIPDEDRPQDDAPGSRRRCSRRPRWLLDFARTRRLPDLTVPNLARARASRRRRSSAPTASGCRPPPPTWEDVAWLREQWGGPFMLKGVMRVDDAKRGRRRRRHRDLGVQPRRQQPRRHAGPDPGAAGGRRRRRRPDRGAARRRHPARQRRRQGARPGCYQSGVGSGLRAKC